jgi:hypothetical protein
MSSPVDNARDSHITQLLYPRLQFPEQSRQDASPAVAVEQCMIRELSACLRALRRKHLHIAAGADSRF